MRILVIGGTQFMGREIVHRLAGRGHDVTVLHRRGTHDLGDHIHNLQADRGDLPTVTRLLGDHGFEAVFDTAYDWQHGTTADQVAAAARACGDTLHRYVFMSSVAAYGGGIDHRESSPLAPDIHPNPYVVHKASTERALFQMHAASGFPVTTLRPPFVHGPRQPFYREQFFWDRLLDGRAIILPDDGSSPMQWAYSVDVAEAAVRAMEVPEAAGEAFNVGHVETLTQRSFVEALARVAGVEPELVGVPREQIHAAGGVLIGANLYFGEFLDPPAIIEVIEKAPRLLGTAPTQLDEALRASFAWYRTQPRRLVDYTFEDQLLSDR
jgi:nucleoside-diphosphate-sugar epimerase